MWRWTIRVLVGLTGLMVLAALAGATYRWLATRKDLASTPPPGQLVDIGGYRLHLWCTGDGAPAVILDTGLGGSTADWGFVQPDVARFTRVCSYRLHSLESTRDARWCDCPSSPSGPTVTAISTPAGVT